MPISDWEELCPQTIVWERMLSRDSYGKPTYDSPQTFRGRRVKKLDRVPGGGPGQGTDQLSSATIWILGIPGVNYEDRVYVQGDTAPYPTIMNIQSFPDENGDLYVKCMMGGASA